MKTTLEILAQAREALYQIPRIDSGNLTMLTLFITASLLTAAVLAVLFLRLRKQYRRERFTCAVFRKLVVELADDLAVAEYIQDVAQRKADGMQECAMRLNFENRRLKSRTLFAESAMADALLKYAERALANPTSETSPQ